MQPATRRLSRRLGAITPVSRRGRHSAKDHLDLAAAFAGTVACYLTHVLPLVRQELAPWRRRAAEIPDPQLRDAAAQALSKTGNIEGAALFATLVPSAHRRTSARALVTFQTAYNYLDALSELPSADPVANGRQLHRALLTALDPGEAHLDYYAHNPGRADSGFLTALIDSCSGALADLPSYTALAPAAIGAAQRIVDFQALNLAEGDGGHNALRRWASSATPASSGAAWWETAAAAGSSLAVHALIAAAADPELDPWEPGRLDLAYGGPVGALHSLLDSLVDRREDSDGGRPSLLGYYSSPADAAIRLAALAKQARMATGTLPDPNGHRVILTAMCSYYLSAPECTGTEAQTIQRALTRALGAPLTVAILMFRSRRLVRILGHRRYT